MRSLRAFALHRCPATCRSQRAVGELGVRFTKQSLLQTMSPTERARLQAKRPLGHAAKIMRSLYLTVSFFDFKTINVIDRSTILRLRSTVFRHISPALHLKAKASPNHTLRPTVFRRCFLQRTGLARRSVTHPALAGCAPSLPRIAFHACLPEDRG